jgi:hypothetical protein
MNKAEVIEAALESLHKVAELKANMQGGAAERLEAMAKVTAGIPWDQIATMSIGWDTVRYTEEGNEHVELLPILNVVMKEDRVM